MNVKETTDINGDTTDCMPPCIIRLKTGIWNDKNGIHIKKDITFLRKLSGHNTYIEEDISSLGATGVVDRITNLYECEDGVYEISACNMTYCWESNYLDDYDYYLSPVKDK